MPQPHDRHATRWKLGLALLVAVFLVAMAASMTVAARRASRVVDPDYYSHGLHYGQTGDLSRNPGVGYAMKASLAAGELTVQITDASGAPVHGGELSFLPQAPAQQSSAPWQFAETSPGRFLARHPAPLSGELRGTLRFTRGQAVASQKLVLLP